MMLKLKFEKKKRFCFAVKNVLLIKAKYILKGKQADF